MWYVHAKTQKITDKVIWDRACHKLHKSNSKGEQELYKNQLKKIFSEIHAKKVSLVQG